MDPLPGGAGRGPPAPVAYMGLLRVLYIAVSSISEQNFQES